MASENPHRGTTLDSLLEETGEAEEVREMVERKWQLTAPPECGRCRGPDCEGCQQSPHWYWWHCVGCWDAQRSPDGK
jgi:hypothetical protein